MDSFHFSENASYWSSVLKPLPKPSTEWRSLQSQVYAPWSIPGSRLPEQLYVFMEHWGSIAALAPFEFLKFDAAVVSEGPAKLSPNKRLCSTPTAPHLCAAHAPRDILRPPRYQDTSHILNCALHFLGFEYIFKTVLVNSVWTRDNEFPISRVDFQNNARGAKSTHSPLTTQKCFYPMPQARILSPLVY